MVFKKGGAQKDDVGVKKEDVPSNAKVHRRLRRAALIGAGGGKEGASLTTQTKEWKGERSEKATRQRASG